MAEEFMDYTFDNGSDFTTQYEFSQEIETGGAKVVGVIVVIALSALVALALRLIWL